MLKIEISAKNIYSQLFRIRPVVSWNNMRNQANLTGPVIRLAYSRCDNI